MAVITKVWYIRRDRTPINWDTAVVDGKARHQIRRAVQTTWTINGVQQSSYLNSYLFARMDDTVTPAQIEKAKAETSPDGLPPLAPVLPPEAGEPTKPALPPQPVDGETAVTAPQLSYAIQTHVEDLRPHPVYDDLPSLKLIFENNLI